MKKLPVIVLLVLVLGALGSCLKTSEAWEQYKEWYYLNQAWLEEQKALTNPDGTPYYTKLVASFDDQKEVYIHYFNDRSKTAKNLRPLVSSTVDVKYIGRLYDGTAFDSSYVNVSPADSIFRTTLTSVIKGWTIALMDMHVGDSCRVVIPYQSAYGTTINESSVIYPYSVLEFDIKLVDINKYEL